MYMLEKEIGRIINAIHYHSIALAISLFAIILALTVPDTADTILARYQQFEDQCLILEYTVDQCLQIWSGK